MNRIVKKGARGWQLAEKVVVIVGASSGIGRVTAKKAAAEGARVVLVGRCETSLREVLAEIEGAGGRGGVMAGDAAVYADMERVAEEAVRRHDRIDVWIHNAGCAEFSYFWKMKPEEIERMVRVNLAGHLFGSRAALPYLMFNPGSSLIHVTTVEAIHGTPYLSVYSAAKSGVSAFLEVLRMELRERRADVHVGEILPAGTDTPFFHNALTRLGVLPSPMGQIADPEVVADAILRCVLKRKEKITIGAGGKLMAFFQRLSPALVRWGMARMTFKGQKTAIPRSPEAPHTLFRPQPRQAAERGGWKAPV